MFSETVEWTGAEHLLAQRAATPEVARQIVAAVGARERMVRESGRRHPRAESRAAEQGRRPDDDRGKGARRDRQGRPAADPRRARSRRSARRAAACISMDTPYFSPESITAMVAGGAQIVIFTTGAGNSYCSLVAPTLKMSANPAATCARLTEQIDFAAAGVARWHGHDARSAPTRASRVSSTSRRDRSPSARSWAKARSREPPRAVDVGIVQPSTRVCQDLAMSFDPAATPPHRHARPCPCRSSASAARRSAAWRPPIPTSRCRRLRRALRRRLALLRRRAVLRHRPRRASPGRVPAPCRPARGRAVDQGGAPARCAVGGGVAHGAAGGSYPFEVRYDYSYDAHAALARAQPAAPRHQRASTSC